MVLLNIPTRNDSLVLLSVLMVLFFLCSLPTMAIRVKADSSLIVGFYDRSCPSVEQIIRTSLRNAVAKDPGVSAGIIRLHFHPPPLSRLFREGSILLDTTPGKPAEKDHPANNPSLHGFEVVDEAKLALETLCPGTVSCADVLAFAARDSMVEAGGRGLYYPLPAGRRDGRVSNKDDIPANLPSPRFNETQLTEFFNNKGMSREEMVTLSGLHSIGVSHCLSFSRRLYSFNTSHPQDPSIDPEYARWLKQRCPRQSHTQAITTVPLDLETPDLLDANYYEDLKRSRGLLTSDQALLSSPATAPLVLNYADNPSIWADKLKSAMVHMGTIGVLTGTEGEIRQHCRIVN